MLAQAYGVSLLCQILEFPRSSFYHQAAGTDDQAVKQAIEVVAAQYPTYGYRRVTAQLRRDHNLVVNHKRVRRLMAALGLQVKLKVRKRVTTHSQHPFPRYPNLVLGLEIIRPDQVWVADITYIRLKQEFVYLAVLLDVFPRSIRGWHLGRGLDQELTLTALRRALSHHTPPIHHSDQGMQYAASTYTDLLTSLKCGISMAEVGQAWQNG